MRNKFKVVPILLLAIAAFAGSALSQGLNPPANLSYVGGKFYARRYEYSGIRINGGGGAAGTTYTIQLSAGQVRLADGRTISPFSAGGFNILGQPGNFPAIPVTVGAGTTKETVTPTAVSGCYNQAPQNTCQITAAFANAHGQGELVTTGSAGIQEAINDAGFFGGGVVVVDGSANLFNGGQGSVTSAITAAIVLPNVSIEDDRGLAPMYWNAQGGLTTLALPTTLTATTAAPVSTPVGAFGTGTYHMCVSYVDLMGQEGPCSADFSEAGLATGSFVFTAPAASTGAVGYTIYISLTSGSYTLSYKVPITSTICTTTTIETTTAACAVTNAGYGQTGATATVTAITVNTSPIAPQSTVVSSTTVYVPNPGGRTTYAYVPGSHMGTPGIVAGTLPFVIAAAPGTTVPTVLGTVNISPGFMNFVGRTLEICGYATTTGSTSTIENIQFQWDALGQNTAGKGVPIGDMTGTTTLATTGHISFCEDFMTTVSGASATAGSIQIAGGAGAVSGVTIAGTNTALGNTFTGATASLNLASEARINVIYLHTTGTDGVGYTLQSLTAKVIN